MRPTFVVLAAALLLTAIGATRATAERRVSDCGERGSKTLLRNEFARVYADSQGSRSVCVYETRVRYPIDGDSSDVEYADGLPFMVLAGKMLFLRFVYREYETNRYDVRVFSLNVLRLHNFSFERHEFVTESIPPPAKEMTGEEAAFEDLVVRRTGAFAAIVCRAPTSSKGDCGKPGPDVPRVVFSPRGHRGPGRELDRGYEIDVRSLRLRERTVTWRKAGVLKSAVLR